VAVISHIEPVASSGNLDGAPKRGHPIIASAGGRSFLFDYSIPMIHGGSMPRGARLDSPGLLQHEMKRCLEKRPIFLDDQDRSSFLDRLGAAGVSIAARRGKVFLRINPGLKESLISTIDK